MKHVMIALVKFYRKCISPLKPPCCRFTPTCSAYALEAFTKRGFFVGLILSVWRILRCNPFSKGGYDPVPEKGLRNKTDSRNAGDIHTECEHTDTTENEKE
ncbi:MAG: membrane protein insertion efficiency factor YidD [Clostridia bacterium]|nr:membrane protein insertion efficiency factor YidD [Clostridia bacterium]